MTPPVKPPLADRFVRAVELSRIDWGDTAFRITYQRPIEFLCRSIEAIGLQRPPLVQEKEPERLRIVSGYRRLRACQRLGKKAVPCQVVDPKTAFADLYLYQLHENLDRGFNTIEQILAVQGLSRFMDEETLVRDYLPLIGLPPQKALLKRWRSLGRVSPFYWPFLLNGRLHPETVERVLVEFPGLSEVLLSWFVFLRLSFQHQKAFLFDLQEIAARRKENLEKQASLLFNLPEFYSRSTTPAQKAEKMRKIFREILFPLLTEQEQCFRTIQKRLGLGSEIKLTPPPFFEGGRYELKIGFSNRQQLQEALQRVSRAVAQGKLDDLP